MPIIKWEPFNELERFLEERPYISLFPKLGWDLAVDLFEEEGSVVAKMSLPGVKTEELDITIDEDMLTVTGTREEEKETDKKDYYSKEIRRGAFSRSVSLPKAVDGSKAEATYADGVLKITMPVVKGQEKRSVKVQVTGK
ncbi:MAG TPA: Hsp20/alpha crystallin family protein [Candidatus Paceibacterota bacterium]